MLESPTAARPAPTLLHHGKPNSDECACGATALPSTLDDVLAQYMIEIDSGVDVDRHALIRRHGQFASELRLFFSTYDLMADMSRRLGESLEAAAVDRPALDETDGPASTQNAHRETVAFGEGSTCAFNDDSAAKTIGRYHVCEAIGGGSFGRVYRCYDDLAHRDVAIKIPGGRTTKAKAQAEEFLHEARSTARLRHPNIVTVLDVQRDSHGQVFIVYEYVPGKTLQHVVAQGDFRRDEAIEWVAQIADALHHAHKHGVIHRDVKPANVLFDEQRRPRLADFGLAKRDDQFFREDKGKILGTCAYMNPEQAARKSHWATPQSDIYSLGVVLYQLLCGRLPFQAKTAADVLQQIRERTPPPPRSIDDTIPKAVEDVCLKAMAKDPADRFRTAADLADALRSTVRPATSGAPRWVVLLSASVAVSLAITFGLLQFLGGTAVPRPSGAAPSTEAAATPVDLVPRLDVHLQRRTQEGDYQRLTAEEFPLQVGDRLQLHATLADNTEAYVYLFWIENDGTVKRFYPDSEIDLSNRSADPHGVRQKKASEIWSPPLADRGTEAQWWSLSSTDGTEAILVATSSRAVSAEELTRFESAKFVLAHDHFGAGPLIEFSSSEPRSTGRTRSVGAQPVSAPKSGQPGLSRLQAELGARFDAHRGYVLRYE